MKNFIYCSFVFIFIMAGNVHALTHQGQPEYVIRLKSRQFVPPAGINLYFYLHLKISPSQKVHAFVQFWEAPEPKIKKFLEKRGIILLFHVQPNVWIASISKKHFNLTDKKLFSIVRWIGGILPTDKIESAILQKKFHDWAFDNSGNIRLSVEFFDDVSQKKAEAILSKVSEKIKPWGILNGWYIIAPLNKIPYLMWKDEVKWIEQGPVPYLPINNNTRQAIHAEEVQEIDMSVEPPVYYGLTGRGIRVGVWDDPIDPEHEDFTGRVVFTTIPGFFHGTFVAGVIGGSGYRSEICEGVPYLLRGMAPEVDFLSYLPHHTWGPRISHFAGAISTHGMEISNHSYTQSTNGRYDSIARQMDTIVRGDADYGGETIPARAMVWAAGNNGEYPEYSSVRGYFSVEAPAKNVITVGSIKKSGSEYFLSDFSSLGPTWDGRIKPEIVAPGDMVKSTDLGNCYRVAFGTSFSAPAITGGLCLLLEQYEITCEVDLDDSPPLPSTLKAILIQTATDLVHDTAGVSDFTNPDTGSPVLYYEGPDYATGYGIMNVQAGAGLIREKNFLEDSVVSRTEMDEYHIFVAPHTEKIQFTLAWDDEPDMDSIGDETDSRIVNNLDLVLLDPYGWPHRPWILDPLIPSTGPEGDIDPYHDDPIDPLDTEPARKGVDNLNNAEQVTVNSPMAGEWKVRVKVSENTSGMFEKPQAYSLAGDFHAQIYFCDWYEKPGYVYVIEKGAPKKIFEATAGRIYHSAFKPDDGRLYISNANENEIIEVTPDMKEFRVVYTHETYVRDLAFDINKELYFSESWGAKDDGAIYKVDLGTGIATKVYTVDLDTVDGSWAGDFCFDREGRYLYLSNGNQVGSNVYRVSLPLSPSSTVEKVYTNPSESICGITFNREGHFFFSNWGGRIGKIYRLNLDTGKQELVYSFKDRYIWDVSFR